MPSKATTDADLIVLMVEPDCVGWNDGSEAESRPMLGVELLSGVCDERLWRGPSGVRCTGVKERGGERLVLFVGCWAGERFAMR